MQHFTLETIKRPWRLVQSSPSENEEAGDKLIVSRGQSSAEASATFLFTHSELIYYIAEIEISIFSNSHDIKAIYQLMLTANHLNNTSMTATFIKSPAHP